MAAVIVIDETTIMNEMVPASDVYGCPECGRCGTGAFLRTAWKKVKDHMRTCCPEQFDRMSTGDLRNMICKLGHAQCEVPGHSFAIYEERRTLQEEENRMGKEAEALKPKWTDYDKRLDGTDAYSGVQEHHIPDRIACSELTVLENGLT
jgi:hypothetical protein